MQGVNEPVGEVKCFRCRWKGHTASMCTNPKVSNVLCALVLRGCQSDGGRVVRVMGQGDQGDGGRVIRVMGAGSSG